MLGRDEDRAARRRLRKTSRHPISPTAVRLSGVRPDTDEDSDVDVDLEDDPGDAVIDIEPAAVHTVLPERTPAREEPRWDGDPNPILSAVWDAPQAAAMQAIRYAKHAVAFHAARTHRYVGRAVAWSPRGILRLWAGCWRWVNDSEAAPLRWMASETGDVAAYMALARQRDDRWRNRAPFAFAGAVLVPVTPVALTVGIWSALSETMWMSAFLLTVALGVFVAVCGHAGRPADRTIVEPSTTTSKGVRRLTNEILREAFESVGLSKARPADGTPSPSKEITFVRDPVRDKADKGYVTVVDLPLGKTAEDALKKRAEIASGLSVARVQVFITPSPESERRIEIYVHDEDPYAELPPVTPLAKMAKLDFWEPFPFGIDARGRVVYLALIWSNMLIGAIPRYGKTFAARLVGLAAALDPYVELIIFDGKPGGSWRAFSKVCYRYAAGVRDTVIDHLIKTLRECVADMNNRQERLDALPVDQVPEAKLTPELARNRQMGMPVRVIIIDEVQRYLQGHGERSKEILALLVELVKVGPSTGYIVVLATQKPTANVIPTDLRDQIDIRMALRMMTTAGSTTILGDVPAGLDPIQFTKKHKGVGVLIGAETDDDAEDNGQIVRTHLLFGQVLEDALDRCHDLRKSLGLLTGLSAGDDVFEESTPHRLLDDVLDSVGLDEDRLPTVTVLERIAAAHPNRYDGWSVDRLRAALRDYGVSTSHQINRKANAPDDDGGRANLRGIDVEEVRESLRRKLNAQGTPLGNR